MSSFERARQRARPGYPDWSHIMFGRRYHFAQGCLFGPDGSVLALLNASESPQSVHVDALVDAWTTFRSVYAAPLPQQEGAREIAWQRRLLHAMQTLTVHDPDWRLLAIRAPRRRSIVSGYRQLIIARIAAMVRGQITGCPQPLAVVAAYLLLACSSDPEIGDARRAQYTPPDPWTPPRSYIPPRS